jgi:hypothetical protein
MICFGPYGAKQMILQDGAILLTEAVGLVARLR